jgi:flagellar basal-body rod modification protein FlgD
MSISTDYSNRNLFINGQLREDSGSGKTDALGKEAFLTMMVAQLKNQDPLNPLEGTDFTAQLAQFSSLEQQITMNTNLSSILESLNTASTNENIFDYMGKTIQSNGNPVTLTGGEVVSGGVFEMKEPATITVTVYDGNGKAVRRMSSGTEQIEAGTYNIEWDGKNDEGYTVLDGEYTYDVKALNAKNQYIDVATKTEGTVTGVTSYGGKAYLMVDGKRIDPDSVESVALAAK